MAEIPTRLAALLPGVLPPEAAPAGYRRPEVKESWDKDFNPVMDATPVVRFGAVYVAPGRYLDAGTGHFLDQNAALIAPETCEECGTDHDENGRIVGPDFRYMVRVQKPEHLFLTKPVYEWAYCRRCLTPDEVETQRQRLLDGMPAPEAMTRPKQRRRTRTWIP